MKLTQGALSRAEQGAQEDAAVAHCSIHGGFTLHNPYGFPILPDKHGAGQKAEFSFRISFLVWSLCLNFFPIISFYYHYPVNGKRESS